jgi:hypothetical protein
VSALTKEERETIIRWDQASDEAIIYTHDAAIMRVLEQCGHKATQEYVFGDRVVAKSYTVTKAWIGVRRPRKATAAMRTALARARKAKPNPPTYAKGDVRSETSARTEHSSLKRTVAG